MAVPAWFWPQEDDSALTVAAALSPDGIIIANWLTDTFYRFNGTAFAPSFSGESLDRAGSAAAIGEKGAALFTSYTGPLSTIDEGSTAPTQTAMPSGNCYTGLAFSGSPYAITSAGKVLNASTLAAVGSGVGTSPAWGLATNGTTLYTLLAASSEIGTVTISSGASGAIALPAPLAMPYCLAVSGSVLAVGGTANATLASGAAQTAFTLNPANPSLLLGVDNGTATIWITSAPNQWTFSTSLSGIGTAVSAAWTPPGTQILVSTNSSIQVLNFSVGSLTLAQTVSVSGAGSIVVMPTGTDAIVVQQSLNQLSTLALSGGTWSVTGTISATAAGPAALVTSTQVAIGIPGSVALFNLVEGVWSAAGNIAVPWSVQQLTVDAAGILYAAGSGGNIAVISNDTVIGTGTGAGTPGGIIASASQVAIADVAADLIRVYGSNGGSAWTQQSTVAMPAGFTGFGIAGQTIFAAGSAETEMYNFGQPYALKAVPFGSAGFYNGTSWTTASLGLGQVPSAVTFSASGNAVVATVQNNLYTVTEAGAVTGGTVSQSAGQPQDVPLGTSSLTVSGSSLYAATSMAGVLVQIQ